VGTGRFGGIALLLDGADAGRRGAKEWPPPLARASTWRLMPLRCGLCGNGHKGGAVPCLVLAIGAMRYLYVAAVGCFRLRLPPPASPFADPPQDDRSRSELGADRGASPATPPNWAAAACAFALGLLVYSFAADIVMQLANKAHG